MKSKELSVADSSCGGHRQKKTSALQSPVKDYWKYPLCPGCVRVVCKCVSGGRLERCLLGMGLYAICRYASSNLRHNTGGLDSVRVCPEDVIEDAVDHHSSNLLQQRLVGNGVFPPGSAG